MDAEDYSLWNAEGDVPSLESALPGSPFDDPRLVFEYPAYGVLTKLPNVGQFRN